MNISLNFLYALSSLFSYDLNIQFYPGQSDASEVLICCHGYGGCASDAKITYDKAQIPHHIISFDFPDARLFEKGAGHTTLSFGTIYELLPLLAIIKACVIDLRMPTIHLYGFSAGGGAVVNALGVLNSFLYDAELQKIGITSEYKYAMLEAIQSGTVILDCPLKSVEEIIAFRGTSPELETIANQYKSNDLRPIDAIKMLVGLNLTILLYFQNPDEILSNRDDTLFYETLAKTVNDSSNVIFLQHDKGGHNMYHYLLWKAYNDLI